MLVAMSDPIDNGPLAGNPFRDTVRFLLRSTWRVLVLIVGLAVTAAGLVMLVTPGPGIVLLVVGLGILATEFAWARRLRDRALDTAKRSAKKLRRSRDSPAA
ncbi:MAG: PGPGW domain-containing protein [Acidimicrobiales bacterium]